MRAAECVTDEGEETEPQLQDPFSYEELNMALMTTKVFGESSTPRPFSFSIHPLFPYIPFQSLDVEFNLSNGVL